MPGHHHRSGSLRQTNKKNKRSKSSKRSLTRAAGGKVAAAGDGTNSRHGGGGGRWSSAMTSLQQQSKANRRNQQIQRREAKKQELLRKKRGIGAPCTNDASSLQASSTSGIQSQLLLTPPPRVVGIVSLGSNGDIEERVRTVISAGANKVVRSQPSALPENSNMNLTYDSTTTVSCKFDVHKKQGHLTLVTCTSSTLPNYHNMIMNDNDDDDDKKKDAAVVLAALDLARVCDVMLFVIADENNDQAAGGRLQRRPNEGTASGSSMPEDMMIPTSIDERSVSAKSARTVVGPDFDYLISERGDKILAALKAQGLPTPLTVLVKHADMEDCFLNGVRKSDSNYNNDDDDDDGMEDQMTMQSTSLKSVRRARVKRQLELKNYVSRFATTEFGTGQDRVVELDLTSTEAAAAAAATSVSTKTEIMDVDVKNHVSSASTIATVTTAAIAGTCSALVRTLCTMSCRPPKWVSTSPRSYLIADFSRYNSSGQELYLTGFVRGIAPFDVNALFHVPNLGTFAAKSVARGGAIVPPLSRHFVQEQDSNVMEDAEGSAMDVLLADPDRQESLDMFASPNALEGEQNLVGFDEDDDINNVMEDDNDKEEEHVARPAGWSDYQSAWLDAVDQEDNAGNDDSDDDNDAGNKDRGELARELNQKKSKMPALTIARGDATLGTAMDMDLDEANDVTLEEKRVLMEQRRKELKENQEFPDEVQVGEDQKASERFARYRSLKSFRKSYWDPKENLPETYASIYHFPRFKITQRSVLNERKEIIRAAEQAGPFWGCTPKSSSGVDDKEEDAAMDGNDDGNNNNSINNNECNGNNSSPDLHDDDDEDEEEEDDILFGCIPSGSYVTLTLRNVPTAPAPGALATAVSLLPHENKVSVLHMAINRRECNSNDNNNTNDAEDDEGTSSRSLLVKSKDVVTFRCGWRTWQGRPVFSQLNLNCDKHPLERFLPTFGAASVFGPVTFGPTMPVLCFVNNQIVAMGTVLGADADRLILKRIVLTGYPVKVHKRHAVVKYMFNNPDDVKWFQPAGLYTKHGLQGNIVSSVGEHGTMKCLFHAPIKQHDTVCLPLYKRVYPKYVENTDSKNYQPGSRSGRYNVIVR